MTSPSRVTYSSIRDAALFVRDENSRTVLFKLPTDADAATVATGVWQYRIATGNAAEDVSVVAVGRSTRGASFAIDSDSWISQRNVSAASASASATGFDIFSRLSRGYSPVLDAAVVARVDRPTGSSVDVQLMDNGLG